MSITRITRVPDSTPAKRDAVDENNTRAANVCIFKCPSTTGTARHRLD